MAYSNMAQLRMLARDGRRRRATGASGRSRSPRRSARPRSSSHALNNVGTAELLTATPRAVASSSSAASTLALDAGLEEHVARAYTNLATRSRVVRDYAVADAQLAAGIAYCRERDLDTWRST